MARNLRKGSKVFVSISGGIISGGILKETPGVVKSASTKNDNVVIRVSSGFAKGKLLERKHKEVKRRSG